MEFYCKQAWQRDGIDNIMVFYEICCNYLKIYFLIDFSKGLCEEWEGKREEGEANFPSYLMSIKYMIFIDSKNYLKIISHANMFYVTFLCFYPSFILPSPLLFTTTADNIYIKLHTYSMVYVLCDCKAIMK